MTSCPPPGHIREPFFHSSYSINTGTINPLDSVDYFVLGLLVTFSCGVGLVNSWNDRKEVGLEEFLVAGRQMSPVTVSLSMTGAFISAFGIVGAPGKIYTKTFMYFLGPVGFFLVVLGAAYIYISVLYRLDVVTAYEYLELRYTRSLRTVGSIIFAIHTTCYLVVQLYAPGEAIVQVTGMSQSYALLCVGLACTLYTASGGIKSVLATDSFQLGVIILALTVTLGAAVSHIGAWPGVLAANMRGGRYVFDDFDWRPSAGTSWWANTIGFYFTFVYRFGACQVQLQRALTCNSLKEAQFALWVVLFFVTIIFTLGCFIGAYISALYENCDPMKAGIIFRSTQLAPLFAMDVLSDYPGLPGVYLAGMCAAAMSTFSSCVNSVAGTIYQDLIQNYTDYYIRDKTARGIMQTTTIALSFLSTMLAFTLFKYPWLFKPIITVSNYTAGPMLGVFTAGLLFPWTNSAGAYTGLFSSLFMVYTMSYFSFKSYKPPKVVKQCINNCPAMLLEKRGIFIETVTQMTSMFNSTTPVPGDARSKKTLPYYVASMWYAPYSCMFCIFVALIVSFLTGPRDPYFMSPRLVAIISNIPPFTHLPYKWRVWLRFGIPTKEQLLASEWPPSSGTTSRATSAGPSKAGSKDYSTAFSTVRSTAI